jgi:hypothetical protein
MSYESWQVHGSRVEKRNVPNQRHRTPRDRGDAAFRLDQGTALYEDNADDWIQQRMLDEAFDVWQPRGRTYRRNWWNLPEFHSLEDERVILMARIADDFAEMQRQSRSHRRRTAKSTR